MMESDYGSSSEFDELEEMDTSEPQRFGGGFSIEYCTSADLDYPDRP